MDCPAGLQEKVCCKSPVQRQTDRLGCFPLCFQERCAEPLCDGSLLTDVFPFITIDKIEYYRHAEMCRRIYHVLHEAHFAARMLRAFLNKHNAFKNLAMKDKIKTGWRAKFG